jgi:nicotinamide-nucleotide amidase
VVSLNLIINDIIVGYEEETIEFWWGYVKKEGKTLSTAESCTGGKIAAVLTRFRASEYFKGSIVCMLRRLK